MLARHTPLLCPHTLPETSQVWALLHAHLSLGSSPPSLHAQVSKDSSNGREAYWPGLWVGSGFISKSSLLELGQEMEPGTSAPCNMEATSFIV